MSSWWGTYETKRDHTLRWQLGPRTLWVTRIEKEWKVATMVGPDPLENTLVVAETVDRPQSDAVDGQRFAAHGDSLTFQLTPLLPDRPVIVKPRQPFTVPSGAESTLFMSLPLWFRVAVGESATELIDEPIVRPSDTWFGPDTMSGELCYSSTTSARLHLVDVPLRPHRAVSPVRIQNHAGSTLQIEKLKIPAPHLSLFASDAGHLWTEGLTLEHTEATSSANVQLADKPTHIGVVERVAPSRKQTSRGFLFDSFGGLFGSPKER